MSEEVKQTCGRRMAEFGPWPHEENLDHWRVEPNGDRTCSFCGSMHPEDFLNFMRKLPENPGCLVSLSDKRYKFYINRPEVRNASEGAIKFYTHHISDEQTFKDLNEACAPAIAVSNQRFREMYK